MLSAGLIGTQWVLEQLDGEPPVEDTVVTARFTHDGMILGSGGCNRYHTAFTASGDTIEIDSEIATTRMACDEPVTVQEASYLVALAAARTSEIVDGRLTITGSRTVSFSAQLQALANTSWQVIAYNDGTAALVSALEGTAPSLRFDEDGTLSGNGGCNALSAGFIAQDGKITVGPVTSTKMACTEPDGVMDQEAEIIGALESAATYVLEGDRLTLRTAHQEIAMELQKDGDAASTGTLVAANMFDIDQPIRFNYSSTSITGAPLVTYQDAVLDLNFRGDEITRVDTVFGELVTVTLENAVDAFVRTFTLIVPSIALTPGESIEFDTFGFETIDRSGAFVPAPGPSGVLQGYRVHSMHGSAQHVVS